ncbi:hypothetical protein [Winogradskyella pulchriflava]|uniref:Glycosyl hydrolase n=1 Tax=Winogradskyella pulchriflava TaxID=1110688 RepID=A0ABV6QB36_9FLAO
MKKTTTLLLLLLFCIGFGQSQQDVDWTKMSNNKGATFYEVQNNFNDYWRNKTVERGKGYKPFKRWESYMESRVYPSGDMSLPSQTYSNFLKWGRANFTLAQRSKAAVSNWKPLGPIGAASGPSPYTTTGAGRVNFLRFDPNDSSIMYLGTPDGGLWKSTNSGSTWTTNTDFLSVIGCSSLAIDPTNTSTMYLVTGDIEGNTNSIGILKSTDGGITWNTTSLAFPVSNLWSLNKLLMDPNNPQRMIVSSNVGVWYTTDGWATNSYSDVGSALKDMEFKPGDANTIYASGTKLYRSTDFGSTWTQVTNGIPTTGVSRIALAVTPGNSSYVYALIGKSSDQSYMGTYRSTNSGVSFTTMSTSPNLLGYAEDGSDSGGQAFYDLSIVASPSNANNITVGGVNHWRSFDGGATWENTSVWDSGEIHADVHELVYQPGSSTTMYSCNDGGIFISTDNGNQWTDISGDLAIGQVVKLGLSANNANRIVAGEQDNGTILNTSALNDWYAINGGDGGECFIDYTNNDIIYVQYVEGKYSRVEYPGPTKTDIQTGLPPNIDFYSPFKMDPVNHLKIYSGGTPTLYASTNQGDNWSALGTSSGTGSIKDFVVAPSDPTVIYTIQHDAISKSTNSGTSFTDITGSLPTWAASLSSVTVSNIDANKVWVTFSGYSSTDKVFKSLDGGATWTNISAGLPNLPMNTLVFRNGGNADEIYVGADVGVYIINNNISEWQPYLTNLPNVTVRDLEIYYPTNKLRAGTYGRGVWETDLNTETLGVDNVSIDSSVNVFVDNNDNLQIKSSLHLISNVEIYDILGKKVFEKENINSLVLNQQSITKSQRILFVKTSLSNGLTVTNKIVF